ncbi:Molybdenum cofactor sulfurase 1 [Gryllus bimaculatus]|nr:Molybdenum cofactor sulfurase 1 [Gryllus bimaculatus]
MDTVANRQFARNVPGYKYAIPLEGICYLDHAGATLYAKSQMNAVHKELNESVFGNPHSLSISSKHTTDVIDQVRYRILKHFHTNPDDYCVIFTSGATAALKLLAESFNWKNGNPEERTRSTDNSVSPGQEINSENNLDISPKESCNCEFKAPLLKVPNREKGGTLVYLQDNHTSVLGIRELAAQKGACVHCMPHDFAFNTLGRKESLPQIHSDTTKTNSLFVYPAQCNFSGVKYPLSWVSKVQSGLMSCNNAECCYNTKWYCCLDAASFVSTNDLDLSVVKPDFVCISFYKMFGFPTGLGALLVRNSSAHTLKRNYFGGGTVQISLSTEMFYVPRYSISERFEDGTVSFLSIVALRHGFDTLQSLTGGMVNVALHTLFLSRYVHHSLLLMHHGNGNPAVVLYCDTDYEDFLTQGNIVNFNLLRSNGEYIGFAEVLHMANLYGIHLRTGCFCNPGACQRHLNLTVNDLKGHYEVVGHICGDEMDLIEGRPTGSVRISFGYMSTKHDADKFLDMITSCFIDAPLLMHVPQWWPYFRRTYREKFNMKKLKNGIYPSTSNAGTDFKTENYNTVVIKDQTFDIRKINALTEEIEINEIKDKFKLSNDEILSAKAKQSLNISSKEDQVHYDSVKNKESYHLSNIFLYPVKSCGPMTVENWEVNSRGLKYDREWMIVNSSGVALTQKQETKLCLIMPKIDLENQNLILEYNGTSPISVPLNHPHFDHKNDREASLCESKVCGDYIQGWDCGDDVAVWLCNTLDRDGLRLLQQGNIKPRNNKYKSKNMNKDLPQAEISLANQSQFLLLNSASVHWLKEQLMDKSLTTENLIRRFRCNFLVEGINAFEEEKWIKVRIGNVELQVEGPCTRCQMVCIDQETGGRSKEPLRSLSAAFHGKMRFGMYLQHQGQGRRSISVGDPVIITL